MRRFLFLLSVVFSLQQNLQADGPIILQEVTNTAFSIGEKLEFVIKYEFITAGKAEMDVKEGPVMGGQQTIHIESRAESNGFIDKFFKVRDYNATTLDADTLVSLNFHQNLREGRYSVIRNTSFDYVNRIYKFQRIRRGTLTERSGPIDEPLQDILSAFFIARTLSLKLGGSYSITVFSDEDVYPLVVKVDPKLHKIKVPAGKFECLRIEPAIRGDAVFQAKEGKMTIWLTNDQKKMPVLIRSKVFIGAVDVELKSFSFGD